MPGKAIGRTAADLPWLCPDADSLVTLAERPTTLAGHAFVDPALLAFLLRYARKGEPGQPVSIPHERLLAPGLPDAAALYLDRVKDAWRDPAHPFNQFLDQFGSTAAALAMELAKLTGKADPQEAGWTAQLATLGWLAISAVNADSASACRDDDRFANDPAGVQQERWELDHDAIARRILTRWKLPERIASVVGQLSLPFDSAKLVVPDADLFAVVVLAVRETERRLGSLGLTRHAGVEEILGHLRLSETQVRSLASETPAARSSVSPHSAPLLPNLLRMAAESRRRNGATLVMRLEEKVDHLQKALTSIAGSTAERIRAGRLRGLAELAAGAGHEINNPLMVIAGHAQRLRQKETDPEREGVLRTIERQTERIASLIKGLMQFARPSRPHPQQWPAGDLLQAVREDLLVEAELRGITLTVDRPEIELWIDADREQVRQALRAVVRNGIEAVEEGGWVRVGASTAESGVAFLIEDSGPGIPDDQQELIFDPFYCGRPAGRGRGLGLSIAWRLAAQNRGQLRYEGQADDATRFRLTFPQVAQDTAADRKSA